MAQPLPTPCIVTAHNDAGIAIMKTRQDLEWNVSALFYFLCRSKHLFMYDTGVTRMAWGYHQSHMDDNVCAQYGQQ